MKTVGITIGVVLLLVVGGGVGVALIRPDLVPFEWKVAEVVESGKEDYGLYCREHGVPEIYCPLCHPELNETLLLCPEHNNIPEDICTLCHPELEEKRDIVVCPEHGLPEAFCYLCELDGDGAMINRVDDGWCELYCELTPEEGEEDPCAYLPLVRLARASLVETVGLRTAPVAAERHRHSVAANAATAYDGNRYAELTPRVTGYLHDVSADLGDVVEPGAVLATIDSAEVSSAKTQYLSAYSAHELTRQTYRRVSTLVRSKAIAAKEEIGARTDLNRAEADLLDAERRLRNLGFDSEDLARILGEKDTASLRDVTAPIAGTVVARHAVPGESVEPTTQLFAVADTGAMWAWIDVYERDIRHIQLGDPVEFVASGGDPEAEPVTYSGEVTWIGTDVDPRTRTTRVRAELANHDGALRANQFGTAEILVGEEHDAVLVPRGAVQDYDGVDLVFLPGDRPGVFRPQRIRAARYRSGDAIEVAWGLDPGQEVVTEGAFLLKTEIMKGAIGAGCCE